ncbi:MAG: hypothetical protein KJ601_03580 [Nanoarchaeota archaeon]|nr:hypothetical protein [Nanoarchaeota archaeon]
MKKRFMFAGLIILALVCGSASAEAFDFVDWVKDVLGIQENDVTTVDVGDIKVADQVPEAPPEIEEAGTDTVTVEEIKVESDAIAKEPVVEEPVIIEEPATEVVVQEPVKEEIKEEAKPEKVTVQKPSSGSSIVIIVEETDKVSLDVNAQDADGDKLTYSYTTPLDQKGEWKTTYGDAGEYTVTVSATDGTLSSSENVLVIVNKKEEAPTIDSFAPTELELSADENTKLEFSAKASDKNKDKLSYAWELDGKKVSDIEKLTYGISYEDAGKHTVSLTVSDGTKTAKKGWSVAVKNVNRLPVLEKVADIKVKENDKVEIKPKATDDDKDKLKYTISEPVGDDGIWQTTYDDAGVYNVDVKVTDGQDEVTQAVKITVENVNRAPIILDIKKK